MVEIFGDEAEGELFPASNGIVVSKTAEKLLGKQLTASVPDVNYNNEDSSIHKTLKNSDKIERRERQSRFSDHIMSCGERRPSVDHMKIKF